MFGLLSAAGERERPMAIVCARSIREQCEGGGGGHTLDSGAHTKSPGSKLNMHSSSRRIESLAKGEKKRMQMLNSKKANRSSSWSN